MSLLKLFIAGIIVICILALGGMVILAIFGSLTVSFVQWLEANPIWRGVLSLVGLVLIVILFLAFSKWVLTKAVQKQ
jgi:membrane protease YdiL (CAAX protease family)